MVARYWSGLDVPTRNHYIRLLHELETMENEARKPGNKVWFCPIGIAADGRPVVTIHLKTWE